MENRARENEFDYLIYFMTKSDFISKKSTQLVHSVFILSMCWYYGLFTFICIVLGNMHMEKREGEKKI